MMKRFVVVSPDVIGPPLFVIEQEDTERLAEALLTIAQMARAGRRTIIVLDVVEAPGNEILAASRPPR